MVVVSWLGPSMVDSCGNWNLRGRVKFHFIFQISINSTTQLTKPNFFTTPTHQPIFQPILSCSNFGVKVTKPFNFTITMYIICSRNLEYFCCYIFRKWTAKRKTLNGAICLLAGASIAGKQIAFCGEALEWLHSIIKMQFLFAAENIIHSYEWCDSYVFCSCVCAFSWAMQWKMARLPM